VGGEVRGWGRQQWEVSAAPSLDAPAEAGATTPGAHKPRHVDQPAAPARLWPLPLTFSMSCQSVTATPRKSSSPRRMSVSRRLLECDGTPLTEPLLIMVVITPASNAARNDGSK